MTPSELTATWLTAIGTLATSLVAILLALYQEKLRRALYHPTLEVTASVTPPDCLKIPMQRIDRQTLQIIAEAQSYYLRIRIRNIGTEPARNVQVYARSLTRIQGDARVPIPEFPPMNLAWSNRAHLTSYPLLAPDTDRFCDVAHIIDPPSREIFGQEELPPFSLPPNQTALSFDLEIKPLTRTYIQGPGVYSLAIEVSAENAKSLRRNLRIELDGRWSDTEATMLGQWVKMHLMHFE
jgi:hypothetical protein